MKLLAEWFWTDRWVGSSAFALPIDARGLYREMLTQAWRREARLPNNPESIQRICGVTLDEWKRCWPKVRRYWRVDGDDLVNDTQLEIYAQALGRAERASERGRAGAQAKLKHNPSRTRAQRKLKPPVTSHQSPEAVTEAVTETGNLSPEEGRSASSPAHPTGSRVAVVAASGGRTPSYADRCALKWEAKYGRKQIWKPGDYVALASAFKRCENPEDADAAWDRFLLNGKDFYRGHPPTKFEQYLHEFIAVTREELGISEKTARGLPALQAFANKPEGS